MFIKDVEKRTVRSRIVRYHEESGVCRYKVELKMKPRARWKASPNGPYDTLFKARIQADAVI